ncbi:MAG: GNAT family N-acetyltransferase [Clostridia bacterium]|nr:GNAT family N-acetyltransferase [Clostridia bacterium]
MTDVAQLIFKTDPYIYPYWFRRYPNWKDILVDLIKTKGSVFYYKNIIVSIIDDKIVGILIYLTNDTDVGLNYDKYIMVNHRFKYTITNYILHLKDFVKEDNVYISNVCIDEQYRKQGHGTALINFIKHKYPSKNLNVHCLKNNAPAIKLYSRACFRVKKRLKGFNAPYKLKPIIYEMQYNVCSQT